MKRLALVGAAVLTTSVVLAPIAMAQETGPNSEACDVAKTSVAGLEKQVADARFAERTTEEKAVADAEAAISGLEGAVATLEDRIEQAVEENQSSGKVDGLRAELATAQENLEAGHQKVADAKAALESDNEATQGIAARLELAVAERDTACGQLEPTPTPEPTEDPEPESDDLNCVDFPLDDGRTAQDVLDDNASDPHDLDVDGDNVACEVTDDADSYVIDLNPDSSDDDTSQVATVPSGGVDTGGGPA